MKDLCDGLPLLCTKDILFVRAVVGGMVTRFLALRRSMVGQNLQVLATRPGRVQWVPPSGRGVIDRCVWHDLRLKEQGSGYDSEIPFICLFLTN